MDSSLGPGGTLRIDWFDGSVSERPAAELVTTAPAESPSEVATSGGSNLEKKLMGFRRLADLADSDPGTVILVLSGRTSFWELLEKELKPDFIVLVAKVVARMCEGSPTLARPLLVRVLDSRYLATLSDYMLSLPSTRINEKRFNGQFWWNVEGLFMSVTCICRATGQLCQERARFAADLLTAARASVAGLQDQHRETVSEALLLTMNDVGRELDRSDFAKVPEIQWTPPTKYQHSSFRNADVLPSREDVVGPVRRSAVEGNLVLGAYEDLEHYLDLQFWLLREDYVAPLRVGITQFLKNPNEHRYDNIRVHTEVSFERPHVCNGHVGHLVRLPPSAPGPKRFMFGSLLLLTRDSFASLLCATVLDSSTALLKSGFLVVALHGAAPSELYRHKFVMVESEVYLEPYRHVLRALQDIRPQDFPMSNYIVHVQTEIKSPAYLTDKTEYILLADRKDCTIAVLDEKQWPSADNLGLDESQCDAYKHALTKEFAVIQGPPGTGKSFLGLQIVKTLLNNLSLTSTPLLVLCYTNHALDQFLENIIDVSTDVVRLGGQSKSQRLQPYTLNNLRARGRSKHSYVYSCKVKQQEDIVKRMMELENQIVKTEKEILSYKSVKPHLMISGKTYSLDHSESKEDPVLKWLFDHLTRNKCDDQKDHAVNSKSEKTTEDSEDDLDSWDDEDLSKTNELHEVESCFSESWALKEIERLQESIVQTRNLMMDERQSERVVLTFQDGIEYLRRRLECLKAYLGRDRAKLSQKTPRRTVRSLDELSTDERWALYFDTADKVREQCLANMTLLENEHIACSAALEELGSLLDVELVSAARVIGATTTVAARRRNLLTALRSPIVIVEEAAEVLEAHIVAALTPHCQHLILIGDHKQLRPTTADHMLSRSHRLDISLMERMALNGVPCARLATQRRMRPRLAALFGPVYPALRSHESAARLPRVRALATDLFFLTHIREEECVGKGRSYRNSWEARWVVALAAHVLRHGYAPTDIALLAAYSAQADLITQMCAREPLLERVRVASVDNYQGEESRIVLLSLVRCNKAGDVGFLAAERRACVALSRAREGLYMFGDMRGLRERSALWRHVDETLRREGAIGESLALRCLNHPENVMQVEFPEQIEDQSCRCAVINLAGGCIIIAAAILGSTQSRQPRPTVRN